MEAESWRRNRERRILEEESRRRNHGRGNMEEEFEEYPEANFTTDEEAYAAEVEAAELYNQALQQSETA